MTKTIELNTDDIECGDCYWHALSAVGIYGTNETVPRNLRRKVLDAYDTEFYNNHEKQNLAVRPMR